MLKTNYVLVSGIVKEPPQYSHSCYNEDFYKLNLLISRTSGIYDSVEIIVPEKLYPIKNISLDDNLRIVGEYRSKNLWENGKNKLILSVFAQNIDLLINTEPVFENKIIIEGFICKDVVYRKTPLSREIADVMVAVNRRIRKSDYIPCIVWGRNAVFASKLPVGTKIKLEGRIQSRRYIKLTEEGNLEKYAMEVSVSSLDIAE